MSTEVGIRIPASRAGCKASMNLASSRISHYPVNVGGDSVHLFFSELLQEVYPRKRVLCSAVEQTSYFRSWASFVCRHEHLRGFWPWVHVPLVSLFVLGEEFQTRLKSVGLVLTLNLTSKPLTFQAALFLSRQLGITPECNIGQGHRG